MQSRTACTIQSVLASLLTIAISAPALGQVLNETVKAIANDGATDDTLGESIALEGDIMVVGATGTDVLGLSSGAVYLFDARSGIQLSKLLASDGTPSDRFGWSCDINMGSVAIGAIHASSGSTDSGAVYMFDAATGLQTVKIIPNDGANADRFGHAVSLDIGEVIIGAPFDDDNGTESGSAYFFDAATGMQIGKLVPADGAAYDRFGSSVSLDRTAGFIVVGSPGDDDNGPVSGSAYVYSAASGALITKLLPTDGTDSASFGSSVSTKDGIVAVGADRDPGAVASVGSVYLFDAATGMQLTKISPSDGAFGDFFGRSVTIDAGIISVSSPGKESVYIYNSSGVFITKLIPSDLGPSGEGFPWAIDLTKNGTHTRIVAGSKHNNNTNGSSAGAAYVFDIDCPGDFNGDLTVDFFDVSAFLTAMAIGDHNADFNGDGVLDFFDVSGFLAAFAAGCP